MDLVTLHVQISCLGNFHSVIWLQPVIAWRRWLWGICVPVCLFLAGCSERVSEDRPARTIVSEAAPSVEEQLAVAAAAVAQGQIDTAEQLLNQCLLANPDHPQALELSADLALKRGQAAVAATIYQSAIDALGREAPPDLFNKWSKTLLRAGRPYESIKALQELIERHPGDANARYDLAGMATAFGVPELALPALIWLVQKGQSDAEMLLVLADPARVKSDQESCQKLLKISGGDPRAEFAIARDHAIDQRWDRVARRLEPIVQQFPDFVEAYALYGQALSEQGRYEQLESWVSQAPQLASQSPLYWMVVGRWEQRRGHHRNASLAFWKSVSQGSLGSSVIYPESLTLWASSLSSLKRSSDAAVVADCISKQSDLRDALVLHLERSTQSQAACMKVAEALAALGRLWEAEGWARIAVSLPEDPLPDIRERYLAIRGRLKVDTPWQLPEQAIAKRIDLSDLSRDPDSQSPWQGPPKPVEVTTQVSLIDEAAARHWNHVSIGPTESGAYTISQTVGGGLAVIDFDNDGWSDIAAATLDGAPLANNSTPNRLYRNLNGMFQEVTHEAGYLDTGYGQGMAVADYNDDGFADLFDANIGRNRLYRNNGDGTFTDVTDSVGLDGERWTSSVAFADLNGDNLVDLFEVNYCAGRAPFERECRHQQELSVCSPMAFDAEPDRVWQGLADGSFSDVSQQWLQATEPGRGLGLVVGALDEQPGLDVVVSNDMTVNHLWSPRVQDQACRLLEIGVTRGIGTNGKSHSQASMGIAAGDADGDGDLDLLMTHFSDEYNTYYQQDSPGFWNDQSYPCGFVESSLPLLGFGTQWIDFDNNGSLELIVTNGHINKHPRDGISYRMPPQLYSRTVDGRWQELSRENLGAYFQQDHLGRALVRLDVNRDGREDVAISHLGDPASLLVNHTEQPGQVLVLDLKATASPRNAVGSRVTASVAGRPVVCHVVSGDGYMAANEAKLYLGCGKASEVSDVTVHWASGRVESFGTMPVGTENLIVEGSGEPFELQRFDLYKSW